MDRTQRYEEARKRVEGSYVHAVVYVLANAMPFSIDFLTPGGWWFFWPLLGWGVGLGAHALNVFGVGGALGREERKVRELIRSGRQVAKGALYGY